MGKLVLNLFHKDLCTRSWHVLSYLFICNVINCLSMVTNLWNYSLRAFLCQLAKCLLPIVSKTQCGWKEVKKQFLSNKYSHKLCFPVDGAANPIALKFQLRLVEIFNFLRVFTSSLFSLLSSLCRLVLTSSQQANSIQSMHTLIA